MLTNFFMIFTNFKSKLGYHAWLEQIVVKLNITTAAKQFDYIGLNIKKEFASPDNLYLLAFRYFIKKIYSILYYCILDKGKFHDTKWVLTVHLKIFPILRQKSYTFLNCRRFDVKPVYWLTVFNSATSDILACATERTLKAVYSYLGSLRGYLRPAHASDPPVLKLLKLPLTVIGMSKLSPSRSFVSS